MWRSVIDAAKTLLNDILEYFGCANLALKPEPYFTTAFYKLLETFKMKSPNTENDMCILGLHIKQPQMCTVLKDILLISVITLGIWISIRTSFRILKRLAHIWNYGSDILKKYENKNNVILRTMLYSCNEMVLRILNRIPVEFSVVGMDCEMCSTSTNGGHPKPAILQLARTDGVCTIFQLLHMKDVLILEKILSNPKILLVGVAVLDDARYLEENYGLRSKGCLDLRHMAKEVGIEPRELAYLASVVLKRTLKKNIKGGPWEFEYLSEKQLNYAALDARTSVDIFMKINNDEICKRHSWFSRLFWDEKTYWDHTLELWNKFVDKQFIFPDFREPYPFHDQLPPITSSCIQSGLYDYHHMCVVCGSYDEKIRKKAIVPFDYLIKSEECFPHFLDLCNNCLRECWEHDRQLREDLREECGAPYPVYNDCKLQSVKELARKILITSTRLQVFTQDEIRLCELLNMDRRKLTFLTLELILSMDCWPRCAHGKHVYYIYNKNSPSGEWELKKYWCDNFVQKMKPRHLPESWKHAYNYDIFSITVKKRVPLQ